MDEPWLKSGSNGCTGSINGQCCQKQTNFEYEPGTLFDQTRFKPYDPSQEPIFPPELKLNASRYLNQDLYFKSPKMAWFRPNHLDHLLRIKSEHPEAKIVVGNTELGVEMKFKNCQYPVMIQPNQVGG